MAQVISDKNIDHIETWTLPQVSAQQDGCDSKKRTPSEEEGYQHGYQQGLEMARQQAYEDVRQDMRSQFSLQWQQQLLMLSNILEKLAQPMLNINQDVETAVLHMIEALVAKMVRAELTLNKEHVRKLIQEAIRLLPVKGKTVTIGLSSQDYQYFSLHAQDDFNGIIARLEEMPDLAPGDFTIRSDTSEVDGMVETRLRRLLAQMTDQYQLFIQDTRPSPLKAQRSGDEDEL